jgi:hypothetical protein
VTRLQSPRGTDECANLNLNGINRQICLNSARRTLNTSRHPTGTITGFELEPGPYLRTPGPRVAVTTRHTTRAHRGRPRNATRAPLHGRCLLFGPRARAVPSPPPIPLLAAARGRGPGSPQLTASSPRPRLLASTWDPINGIAVFPFRRPSQFITPSRPVPFRSGCSL